MVPSHELRFRSMLRAMVEVIIPALPAEQRLAIDQAQIVAGNLRILIDQAGRTTDFARTELAEWTLLGDALGALLGAPAPAPAAAPADERALDAAVTAAKQAVDAMLKTALAHDDPAVRAAAARLTLDQAETQLRRERVWLRGAGFELDPDALPALDAVLAPSERPA